MKKLKLWAIAFLAFPCLGAMGENVYVYNDAAGEPVQAFTDIRKITFTEDAMHVMAANGTSTEVLFADFNYFTFVEKENSGIGTDSFGCGRVSRQGQQPFDYFRQRDKQGRDVLRQREQGG